MFMLRQKCVFCAFGHTLTRVLRTKKEILENIFEADPITQVILYNGKHSCWGGEQKHVTATCMSIAQYISRMRGGYSALYSCVCRQVIATNNLIMRLISL